LTLKIGPSRSSSSSRRRSCRRAHNSLRTTRLRKRLAACSWILSATQKLTILSTRTASLREPTTGRSSWAVRRTNNTKEATPCLERRLLHTSSHSSGRPNPQSLPRHRTKLFSTSIRQGCRPIRSIRSGTKERLRKGKLTWAKRPSSNSYRT
jgi:hypothetical protein